MAEPSPIQVLRPRLASAGRIARYLRRIDSNRVYSNWGPLVAEFEERLGGYFGLPPSCVVSAGSGSAAIVGAVLAVAGRASEARPLALVPGFTFTGTASALEQCGYQLFLADVDALTWSLDPQRLEAELPRSVLDRIGVVVPVGALGRGVAVQPWQAFRERTGIEVVIDGAATFEALSADPASMLGSVPVALSFHATKSVSTGEGGCVAVNDARIAADVVRALNFGFAGTRESRSASTNGKMSEYHAAVGLSELDIWPKKRRAIGRAVATYRALSRSAGFENRLITAPDICSSYALFVAADAAEAERVAARLTAARIDHRFWYGKGLHHHAYWAVADREPLPVTENLSARLVGLPMAPDLRREEMERVIAAIARAIGGA